MSNERMPGWVRCWREAVDPRLRDHELLALRDGLRRGDPRITKGTWVCTGMSPDEAPYQCCPIGYAVCRDLIDQPENPEDVVYRGHMRLMGRGLKGSGVVGDFIRDVDFGCISMADVLVEVERSCVERGIEHQEYEPLTRAS